jgi:hypothetical protein
MEAILLNVDGRSGRGREGGYKRRGWRHILDPLALHSLPLSQQITIFLWAQVGPRGDLGWVKLG